MPIMTLQRVWRDGFRVMPSRGLARAACAAVALMLYACAAPPPRVPVEEARTLPGHRVVPLSAYSANEGIYTVRRGDTLSDIAYDYRTTVQHIVQRNGLLQSHLIYPGQRLIINNANKKRRKPHDRVIKIPISSYVDRPSYKFSNNHEKLIQPRYGNSRGNNVLIEWRWPAHGQIIQQFNRGNPPSKGIDIDARYGDPVYAAAAGTVAYTGEGLRGYGKLIIIAHEDGFLSAYGNNKRVRVRENQSVAAGEEIASIGTSASGRSVLHFEIRREGVPRDPLRYLPTRN